MQISAPTPFIHRFLGMLPATWLARLDALSSQAAQKKLAARRRASQQRRFDFDRAL